MSTIIGLESNVEITLYRPSTDEIIYHNLKKNMCGPGALVHWGWRRVDGWLHNSYQTMALSTDSSAAPTDTALATWRTVKTNFHDGVFASLNRDQNDSNGTFIPSGSHLSSPPYATLACSYKLPYGNGSTVKKMAIYKNVDGTYVDNYWGIAHIITLSAEEQFTKTASDILYVNWTIYYNGDRTANEY